VAGWDDLISYVRVRYEVMRHTDDEVWFELPTRDERTQLVAVRRVSDADGHPWARLDSPVGRAGELDLHRLLELAAASVVGGAVSTGGVVVIRHAVPLHETAPAGFERAFRAVVDVADRLEEELTGRDEH